MDRGRDERLPRGVTPSPRVARRWQCARVTASYSVMIFSCFPALRVNRPVVSVAPKSADRIICQSCCPWGVKFSQALAEDSPFRSREYTAGTDAVTLSSDMFALDQHALRAAFRKSPMNRAKLRGL